LAQCEEIVVQAVQQIVFELRRYFTAFPSEIHPATQATGNKQHATGNKQQATGNRQEEARGGRQRAGALRDVSR